MFQISSFEWQKTNALIKYQSKCKEKIIVKNLFSLKYLHIFVANVNIRNMLSFNSDILQSPNLIPEIRKRKEELSKIEIERHRILTELNILTAHHESQIKIHWREEIRRCLKNRIGNSVLINSNAVAQCVAYRNELTINRNIKLKIATTLSMMYREGEIGRTEKEKDSDYFYGNKELFQKDLKTLKKDVLKNVEYEDNIYQ